MHELGMYSAGCIYILSEKGENVMLLISDSVQATGIYPQFSAPKEQKRCNSRTRNLIDVPRLQSSSCRNLYIQRPRGSKMYSHAAWKDPMGTLC